MRRVTSFEMEADMLIHLVNAVDRIEKQLAALQETQTESEWLSPEEFCKLASITNRENLRWHVRKGHIHGDAIRNIGTTKRQNLRYHRTKALDQYLKKV